MRILLMSNSDLNLVLGSAAALNSQGHHVFHVESSESSLESSTEKIKVEVHEGMPVVLSQMRIPVTQQESIAGRRIRPQRVSTPVLTSLKELSPELIMSYPECWMLARSISKELHIPLVFYSRDIRGLLLFAWLRLYHKYSDIPSAPLSCLYNVALAELSDFTIASGKRIENFLRHFGVRNIATLSPPFARFRFPLNKPHIELPESFLLVITTLSRERNVEVDLEVFRIVMALARRIPEVPFVIVGTSANDLIYLGKDVVVPSNVHLIGRTFDDDLLGLVYKKAICILCPIRYPNISNRVHEALFYGKPLITTKTVAEFYGGLIDGEHCIIEEDFGNWPIKIRRIVGDSNLRENLEAGARRYYTKTFSPERHAQALEHILNYVVKRAAT